MRFSLSTLILLVLVSALAVNLFLIDRERKTTEVQIVENAEQAQVLDIDIGFAEPQDLQGTCARAANQLTEIESGLNNVRQQFQEFATEEGQLSIDRNLFSIKTIPSTNERNRHFFSYRIFVPDKMSLAAKVDFQEVETVEYGATISDAVDFLFPLTSGESTLTLVYEQMQGENTEPQFFLKLQVNDQEVKSWEVISPQQQFGIVASYPFLRHQRNLSRFEKQKLVGNFSANQSEQRFDFLIVEVDHE